MLFSNAEWPIHSFIHSFIQANIDLTLSMFKTPCWDLTTSGVEVVGCKHTSRYEFKLQNIIFMKKNPYEVAALNQGSQHK